MLVHLGYLQTYLSTWQKSICLAFWINQYLSSLCKLENFQHENKQFQGKAGICNWSESSFKPPWKYSFSYVLSPYLCCSQPPAPAVLVTGINIRM